MITALAIRIAATRALTGRTFAEGRVYDSAIRALDDLIQEQAAPILVVATEEQVREVDARDVLAGNGTLDLVIEAAVASAVPLDGGEDMAVVIPHTDAGSELAVNLLSRQVMRTLFEGGDAWGLVFRKLAPEVRRVHVRRGAGSKDGTRFAAAQIVITLAPLHEPAWGEVPPEGTAWGAFLTQVGADPETAALADGIAAVITGDTIPDWRKLWTVLSLTDGEAAGLGLAPYIQPMETPAVLDEIRTPSVTITAETTDPVTPETPVPFGSPYASMNIPILL